MEIYSIDIGEILTIAAPDAQEAAVLAFRWFLQSAGVDGLAEFEFGRDILIRDDDFVVKMVHPSEMTVTVEWLKSLITTPQVIGSSEY